MINQGSRATEKEKKERVPRIVNAYIRTRLAYKDRGRIK